MGIFFNKNKSDKSTINPKIMEGFLNKIDDIICIANFDGTIEIINNAEINTNYKTLSDFFSEKENKELYDTIISTVKRDGCYINDIELYRKNEKVRMYVAAYCVTSLKKLFFYIRDTNKYFEKEIELLEELDRQDEYLKSKDLFIANLSHEIRTPINIIVGMIYFLKDTQLDETQLEYVNKLDEAASLLLEMTNGILDLSERKNYVEVNTKTDFNLNNFLDNIIEMFDQRIKDKGLQLYLDIAIESDINIYADKGRLSQVIVNLLENAVKYTDKGYIELDVKKVAENNVCYKFQFCLKDTGIGIKREDSLNIFREFSQVNDPTTKTKEGKGMGLAIAKKIVEDMNGKMWVESSVGLGSKFYFNITVDKSNKTSGEIAEAHKIAEEHALFATKSKVNSDNNEKKKILLVEDNEMNIEITKKILEEEYICDVAQDGVKCIKQIKDVGINYYDLILMDIHMPRYNGYEISKILKNDLDVQVPIVALTATNITDEVIKKNSNYIVDYIQKPIRPTELKEKIKTYISFDLLVEENVNKKHVVLFGEDKDRLEYLKSRLVKNFEVAITKSEVDIQILLETGVVEAIIIDELENLDKEVELINIIKCDNNYSEIPMILINNNPESNLKEIAYQHEIRGIVEKFEIEQCGLAVKNILDKNQRETELEHIVEKAKEETENVYNYLFESMVNLTTSKSKETGEHLIRTKQYMKVMLKKYEEFYQENLFKESDVIEEISTAAILHDIGKVGIPDNVLNKPGRLNDEEFEIIKTHVIIGKNILENTYGDKVSNSILDYAKDIVYHHHEKYDGTGYPEKLKGEEITIISRIMALIDVYDALANDRVYKKAMPYEEVDAFIKEQSGKAFDPKVVNVYFLVKDELKEINEQNKDKK